MGAFPEYSSASSANGEVFRIFPDLFRKAVIHLSLGDMLQNTVASHAPRERVKFV